MHNGAGRGDRIRQCVAHAIQQQRTRPETIRSRCLLQHDRCDGEWPGPPARSSAMHALTGEAALTRIILPEWSTASSIARRLAFGSDKTNCFSSACWRHPKSRGRSSSGATAVGQKWVREFAQAGAPTDARVGRTQVGQLDAECRGLLSLNGTSLCNDLAAIVCHLFTDAGGALAPERPQAAPRRRRTT